VQALAKTGCRVRVAVRQPNNAIYLQTQGSVGQIHAVQANLRYEDSVKRALEGADAAVNLVGILQPTGKQSFEAVQAEGAGAIARAAKAAGAKALVHVSAIGADAKSPSAYARSKARGEELVRERFIQSVILRPSLVFGTEDEFFNRFAAMARFTPVMPLFGGGKTRFQPVYVGDVAKAVVAGLDGRARAGVPYELGGPSIYTFRELLDMIGEYTTRKRGYVSIPFWLGKLQAAILQMVPGAPLTIDQVRMLQTDNVVSADAIREARTLKELGIAPQAVEAIVPQYLVRFRPKGEFSVRAV
jgi:NADH dehydrogenase